MLANVFVLVPMKVVLAKALFPIMYPEMVCATGLVVEPKKTVPPLALNPPVVLELVKSPPMVSCVLGKVTVPEVASMVRLVVETTP